MYSQSITRAHRTAFILLIDGSGSMAEELLFRGRTQSKAEAVATITNELIFELIERARRTEGVRDYYDIAVLGYGGDDCVYALLDAERPIMSVTELAAKPIDLHRQLIDMRQPDGSIAQREFCTPQWVKPHCTGQTPMLEALRIARDLLKEWVLRPENAASFPPVVFNITDGEATDGTDNDLYGVAEEIRSLATTEGNVLLLNIHIAPATSTSGCCFPSANELGEMSRHAHLLYSCSSEMPACFNEAIRSIKGLQAEPPFRGMSFNASVADVVAMLDIGSISVKTE